MTEPKKQMNLSEIAKELNVSISTVSRTLSGSGRIGPGTRKKILDFVSDVEIIRNRRLRPYQETQTSVIAVMVCMHSIFSSKASLCEIVRLLYRYFSLREYEILLLIDEDNGHGQLIKAIDEHRMDGVVCIGHSKDEKEFSILKKYDVPFVMIGVTGSDQVPQVSLNAEECAYEMTNYLLGKRLFRQAVIGSDHDSLNSMAYIRGIQKAHMEHYSFLDPKMIFLNADDDALLAMKLDKCLAEEVECIICMDESSCLNVIRYLRMNHVDIPNRICLSLLEAGFTMEDLIPTIAGLDFSMEQMADEAARQLMIRMGMQGGEEKMHSIIDYRIIVKESVKGK